MRKGNVCCVKKLHYLIGGRRFYVRSDHKNLQYWTNPSASAKVERWKIFLSEYDYSIDYIKGEDNGVADALSRMECVQEGQVVPTFPQVVDMTLKAVVIAQSTSRFLSPHDSDIELLMEGQEAILAYKKHYVGYVVGH